MAEPMHAEDRAHAERLVAIIQDRIGIADEPYHAQDCPACDMADQIVAEIAAELDPHENWYPLPGDPPEAEADSYARVLVRRVAFVLHRRLAGHQPGGGR